MINHSLRNQLMFDDKKKLYHCKGNWSILKIGHLHQRFQQISLPKSQQIKISGKALRQFDSAGALTLWHCIQALKKNDNQIELIDFQAQHRSLYDLIEEKSPEIQSVPPPPQSKSALYHIGEETVHKIHQANGLVILIGDLSAKLLGAIHQLHRFQLPGIVTNIYTTGITALPIIGLLSFLIGVVLAYQMGLQLETYGVNFFIAYLSGMALFREFAPLITAIIVAGRTSSAFTAQIGSMKLNEEIDALKTMGLSPTELLVVPKVLGLLLIFPLLIFWSDFFSILGAMLMAKMMLHVGYTDFLSRLQDTVGFRQMALGMYKAPTFAILIALVGCFQGFCVESNADSLGAKTTKSVVQALFLIIIADAGYSIIYSWLNV